MSVVIKSKSQLTMTVKSRTKHATDVYNPDYPIIPIYIM